MQEKSETEEENLHSKLPEKTILSIQGNYPIAAYVRRQVEIILSLETKTQKKYYYDVNFQKQSNKTRNPGLSSH